jgi:hypothetical protein
MPSPDAAAIERALRARGTAERAVKEKAHLKCRRVIGQP